MLSSDHKTSLFSLEKAIHEGNLALVQEGVVAAASEGHTKALELLIANNADLTKSRPLALAILNNHHGCVVLLIKAGVIPSIDTLGDSFDFTKVIVNGFPEVGTLLFTQQAFCKNYPYGQMERTRKRIELITLATETDKDNNYDCLVALINNGLLKSVQRARENPVTISNQIPILNKISIDDEHIVMDSWQWERSPEQFRQHSGGNNFLMHMLLTTDNKLKRTQLLKILLEKCTTQLGPLEFQNTRRLSEATSKRKDATHTFSYGLFYGYTPLLMAAYVGCEDSVTYLFNVGCKLSSQFNFPKRAIEVLDDLEFGHVLKLKKDAIISEEEISKVREIHALDICVQRRHTSCIKTIVELDVSPEQIVKSLHSAMEKKFIQGVEILLEACISRNIKDFTDEILFKSTSFKCIEAVINATDNTDFILQTKSMNPSGLLAQRSGNPQRAFSYNFGPKSVGSPATGQPKYGAPKSTETREVNILEFLVHKINHGSDEDCIECMQIMKLILGMRRLKPTECLKLLNWYKLSGQEEDISFLIVELYNQGACVDFDMVVRSLELGVKSIDLPVKLASKLDINTLLKVSPRSDIGFDQAKTSTLLCRCLRYSGDLIEPFLDHLFEERGADANLLNEYGESALMVAVSFQELHIVNKIIDQMNKEGGIHKNIINALDKNGNSALIFALQNNVDSSITQLLVKEMQKSGYDKSAMNVINDEGNSALVIALTKKADPSIVHLLVDEMRKAGSDLTVNSDGTSVLMHALKKVIFSSPDPTKNTSTGFWGGGQFNQKKEETVTFESAFENNGSVLEMAINKMIDHSLIQLLVEEIEKEGPEKAPSPEQVVKSLHSAMEKKFIQGVEILLEACISRNIKDFTDEILFKSTSFKCIEAVINATDNTDFILQTKSMNTSDPLLKRPSVSQARGNAHFGGGGQSSAFGSSTSSSSYNFGTPVTGFGQPGFGFSKSTETREVDILEFLVHKINHGSDEDCIECMQIMKLILGMRRLEPTECLKLLNWYKLSGQEEDISFLIVELYNQGACVDFDMVVRSLELGVKSIDLSVKLASKFDINALLEVSPRSDLHHEQAKTSTLLCRCLRYSGDLIEPFLDHLFEERGADANLLNEYGESALMVAVSFQELHIVKKIIDQMNKEGGIHKNIINALDKNGNSALIFALQKKVSSSITQLLVKEMNRGGHTKSAINSKNKDNNSPMDIAYELFNQRYEDLRPMIAAGGAITSKEERDDFFSCYHQPIPTRQIFTDFVAIDLPFQFDQKTGEIYKNQNHNNTWLDFLEASDKNKIPVDYRVHIAKTILENANTLDARYAQELIRYVSAGRKLFDLVDESVQDIMKPYIYFCGRYDLHKGPPLHKSATAVVLLATDINKIDLYEKNFKEFLSENKQVTTTTGMNLNQFLEFLSSLPVVDQQIEERDNSFEEYSTDGMMSCEQFVSFCTKTFGKPPIDVAIKLMRNKDQYEREVSVRETGKFYRQYVVGLVDGPSIEEFKIAVQDPMNSNLNLKEYIYGFVMEAGDRSLETIFQSERPDIYTIREVARKVASSIHHIHSQKVMHGDVKMLNVVRYIDRMCLIDMDAACDFDAQTLYDSKTNKHFDITTMMMTTIELSNYKLTQELIFKITDFLNLESKLQFQNTSMNIHYNLLGKQKSFAGAKFSSAILPPEMFYEFEDDEEEVQYYNYWQKYCNDENDLWSKIAPLKYYRKRNIHSYVVRTFNYAFNQTMSNQDYKQGNINKDNYQLPYDLIPSSDKIDIWSFGVMLYKLCSGGTPLIASNRDDDIKDPALMFKVANMTDKDIDKLILENIKDAAAVSLLQKILRTDPDERLQMEKVLEEPFFNPNLNNKWDSAAVATLASLEKKMDEQLELLRTTQERIEEINKRTIDISDRNEAMFNFMQTSHRILLRGVFEATEVQVPTCFVILSDKLPESTATTTLKETESSSSFQPNQYLSNANKILDGLSQIGTALTKITNLQNNVQEYFNEMVTQEVYYFYLVDEYTMQPVTGMKGYPIEIKEPAQFLKEVLPLLKVGLKAMAVVNTVAGMGKCFGIPVPCLTGDTLAKAEAAIGGLDKESSVSDFNAIHQHLTNSTKQQRQGSRNKNKSLSSKCDPMEEVEQNRGAALRDLERFYQQHDSSNSFCGLQRVCNPAGHACWTLPSNAEAMQENKLPIPPPVELTSSQQTEDNIVQAIAELEKKHRAEVTFLQQQFGSQSEELEQAKAELMKHQANHQSSMVGSRQSELHLTTESSISQAQAEEKSTSPVTATTNKPSTVSEELNMVQAVHKLQPSSSSSQFDICSSFNMASHMSCESLVGRKVFIEGFGRKVGQVVKFSKKSFTEFTSSPHIIKFDGDESTEVPVVLFRMKNTRYVGKRFVILD